MPDCSGVRKNADDGSLTVVRRRLAAGLRNFENAYKPAVDAWAKYDNVGESPILLEWGEKP